jgi:hypothetical protein
MKKRFLFYVLIALSYGVSGQKLSFYRENITMKIQEQQFYVSGTYYFRYNLTDKKLLYYPFPTGDQYGNPDSVFLYDLTNNTPVEPMKQDSSGLLFLVDFSKNSDISVQISYKQPLLGNQAKYILETTKVWGKPIEEAFYQLITPANIVITRFAIPPHDSIITNLEKIYTWEESDYMPERNMVFEFEQK